ncbi:flocculation protein FLO11-like [Portunus trituberculatus]|uniref:flocculation protein FLO11-like n=1 Tax=Portunus trituberculatus TaxID=210409 RepID=UPI001E1D0806|nr:flocculation protein FLO11-like [Portunus trituberculatus]
MSSSLVMEDSPSSIPAEKRHAGPAHTSPEAAAHAGWERSSAVVTRLPGDRWQPQPLPSLSSSASPQQPPLGGGSTLTPLPTPNPLISNPPAAKKAATPSHKPDATNQQAKILAFRNSKANLHQLSPHLPHPTLSWGSERGIPEAISPSSPPNAGRRKTEDWEEGSATGTKASSTKSSPLVSARSTSYDADTEESSEALLSQDSGSSFDAAHQSTSSVSPHTHQPATQKAGVSPSPQRSKGTAILTASSPSPPKGKIIKCSKLGGSNNWLDRSSSIHDLGGLFQEVKRSREFLNKSREYLARPSLKVESSSMPLSRTKSVSSLQHFGLASAKDSGLSKSSWDLNNVIGSPPSFHSLRTASSSSFSESHRPRPHPTAQEEPSPASPDWPGWPGHGRLSLPHCALHPRHSQARPAKGIGMTSPHLPARPQTPAFQEDVYYTIQGEAGVTQHYQAEDSRSWHHLQEDHRPLTYTSSEDDSELEEPMYQPLQEWPPSEALNSHYLSESPYSPSDSYPPPHYVPTEAYNPHYGEMTHYSPRSSRHSWHSPPPPSPHYPPISPKSPKSPRQQRHHHKYYLGGHSTYQTYHGPGFSPMSLHPHSCHGSQCSPQSPHYQLSRPCMLHSHPHSPSSRPWPSSPAQLEMGCVYSWTVSSCTQSPFGHRGVLSLSVWGSCIPHTLSCLSLCTPPTQSSLPHPTPILCPHLLCES